MARPLLRRLPEAQEEEREALVSALTATRLGSEPESSVHSRWRPLTDLLQTGDVPLQLTIFRCFQAMLEQSPALSARLEPVLARLDAGDSFAVSYERTVLLNRHCGHQDPLPQADSSELFLSNLKNALHWTVKLVHIDLLRNLAQANPSEAFHTAMHFSNLLSVSEHLPVREYAGAALLSLTPYLTVDQRNVTGGPDPGAGNGQEQISITSPFLGRLVCQMPDKELD
ncbi:MAG: hypothetical protein ACLU9S_11725 [Oscillospiraceae bacterium]